MTTGLRFVLPYQTLVNPLGVPYPGATLAFYATGTDDPIDTFADYALTVANPNPVTAGSNGMFGNIFLTPNILYKVIAHDENGVELWSADPLQTAPLADQNINDLVGILETSKGGSGVGDGSLTGLLVGNGSSPFTAIPPPDGSLVGTTAIQTLTNKTLTAPVANGGTLTAMDYASTIKSNAGTAYNFGTLGIVKRAVAIAVQLAQTDNGTCIESTATGNVLTVPQFSDAAITSDFAVEYYNRTASNVTIVSGTGVTLRLMGGGALTGNRVLAQWSKCTIEASATLNEFTIAGAGVS